MRKHGLDAFIVGILEFLPPDASREAILTSEQYFLDKFRPFDRSTGYNLCKVAGSPIGTKRSKKFCAANRLKNIGLLTNARLCASDIPIIFAESASGKTRSEVAALYSVHHNTITAILTRRCWWHVHVDPALINKSRNSGVPAWTSKAKIRKLGDYLIRFDVLEDSYSSLAKKFGICRRTVEKVNNGTSFPAIKNRLRPHRAYIAQPKGRSYARCKREGN